MGDRLGGWWEGEHTLSNVGGLARYAVKGMLFEYDGGQARWVGGRTHTVIYTCRRSGIVCYMYLLCHRYRLNSVLKSILYWPEVFIA